MRKSVDVGKDDTRVDGVNKEDVEDGDPYRAV